MQTEQCPACGQDFLTESGVRGRTQSQRYCSAYCLRQTEGTPAQAAPRPPSAFHARQSHSLTPWVIGGCLLLAVLVSMYGLRPASDQGDHPEQMNAVASAEFEQQTPADSPNPLPSDARPEPTSAASENNALDLQAALQLEAEQPEAALRAVEALLRKAPSQAAYQALFRMQLKAGQREAAFSTAQSCLQLATELSHQAACHHLFLDAYTQEAEERADKRFSQNTLRHLDALMAIDPQATLYVFKARVLCPVAPEAARSNLDAGCAKGDAEACHLRCSDGQIAVPQPESASAERAETPSDDALELPLDADPIPHESEVSHVVTPPPLD